MSKKSEVAKIVAGKAFWYGLQVLDFTDTRFCSYLSEIKLLEM
jgi:hypothetical protein